MHSDGGKRVEGSDGFERVSNTASVATCDSQEGLAPEILSTLFDLVDCGRVSYNHESFESLLRSPSVQGETAAEIARAVNNGRPACASQAPMGHQVESGYLGLMNHKGRIEAVTEGRWAIGFHRAHWMNNASLSFVEPIVVASSTSSAVLTVVRVPHGKFGIATEGTEAVFLNEGLHVYNSPSFRFERLEDSSAPHVSHKGMHMVHVRSNQYAKVWTSCVSDVRVPKLLRAGVHVVNSPHFSFEGLCDASEIHIGFGKYQIMQVPAFQIAKVRKDGVALYLSGGTHCIESANFSFDKLVPSNEVSATFVDIQSPRTSSCWRGSLAGGFPVSPAKVDPLQGKAGAVCLADGSGAYQPPPRPADELEESAAAEELSAEAVEDQMRARAAIAEAMSTRNIDDLENSLIESEAARLSRDELVEVKRVLAEAQDRRASAERALLMAREGDSADALAAAIEEAVAAETKLTDPLAAARKDLEARRARRALSEAMEGAGLDALNACLERCVVAGVPEADLASGWALVGQKVAERKSHEENAQKAARREERRCNGRMLVTVIGAGPAGLTFAVCAAELAKHLGIGPDALTIDIYELRAESEGDSDRRCLQHPPEEAAAAAAAAAATATICAESGREHVVPLQFSTLKLLNSLSRDTRDCFRGDLVWPSAESVTVRSLEEKLCRCAQHEGLREYLRIHRLPPELAESVRNTPPNQRCQQLLDWFGELECDVLVGADGVHSMVRSQFPDNFLYKLLADRLPGQRLKNDHCVTINFEGGVGFEQEAVNTLITFSQNRYSFNAANGGTRGSVSIRLTATEFSTLLDGAEGPCRGMLPSHLWDITSASVAGGPPRFLSNAKFRATIMEALRLFAVSPAFVRDVFAHEVVPAYADKCWARAAGYQIFLIGDAAMAPHFWLGRGTDTAVRSAVALSRALVGAVKQPEREHLYKKFEVFMSKLAEAEVLSRSVPLLLPADHGPPSLPPHVDEPASFEVAAAQADKAAARLMDRVKGWRSRLRDEPEDWLRGGAASDVLLQARFSAAQRPSPCVLKLMNDSAVECEEHNVWGWPLPAKPVAGGWPLPKLGRELLPDDFGLPDPASHTDGARLCAQAVEKEIARRREEVVAELLHMRARHVLEQTAKERTAYLREEERRGASPYEYYDFVMEVDSFGDLFKEGWKMQMTEQVRTGLGDDATTRIVIIGNFKKGKTWLMQKLTNTVLPSNEVAHTPGLCSKRIVVDGKPCYLLDVKGENSPLKDMDRESLMDKKAEESFLREMVCDISDAFVYMVGSVGYGEQLTLWQLCTSLRVYRKASNMIIVVHNLRHITRKVDLRRAENEIIELYESSGLTRQERHVHDPLTGTQKTVWFLEPSLELNSDSDANRFQARHFVLAAEGSEAGDLNNIVIDRIRNTILDCALTKKPSLKEEIVETVRRRIPKYLVGSLACEVEAEDGVLRLRQVLPPDAKDSSPAHAPEDPERMGTQRGGGVDLPLALREMDLGHFVSVRQDSKTWVPYRISETSTHVKVEIDVPGLTEETIPSVMKVTKTLDGVQIQVKSDLGWQKLPDGARLIEGTTSNSIDLVINVRKMLANAKKPSAKHLRDGTYTLEWEIDSDEIPL